MGRNFPANLTGLNSLQTILTSSQSLASKIAELPTLRKLAYCFVLDVSASMEGESLREMKAGCLEASASLLRRGFTVSVIAFHSTATLVAREVKSFGEIQDRVKALESKGTTALDKAFDLAFETMQDSPGSVIHIVTDGNPDNRESAIASANKMKAAGFCIRCSGVAGADQAFLLLIAGGETEPQAKVITPNELKALISKVAALPMPGER